VSYQHNKYSTFSACHSEKGPLNQLILLNQNRLIGYFRGDFDMRIGLLGNLILNSFVATLILAAGSVSFAAEAQGTVPKVTLQAQENFNVMDEIDPFDPEIDQKLQEFDQIYQEETGEDAHIGQSKPDFGSLTLFRLPKPETCVREQCEVWVQVVRSTQTLYLYIRGEHKATWKVSSGVPGRGTPNFDKHPDGRIYDRYTSVKFPGGDYRGLGNMPYAVFIQGGFAIHGTAEVNWKKLGQRASHGCIRVHPDNAYYFNRLVRQVGVAYTWITVQE
jgi:lipoprotein-anchoring transpeptidase ErfK/SrfK